MMPFPMRRLATAAVLLLTVLAGACSSDPNKLPPDNPFKSGKSERELRLEADGLYRLARRSLESSDYQAAIQRYDQIVLRYPFTDFATQAQIEGIYARYRSYDADGAVGSAERFLKEYPRHASADYVQYLKGLVNFERSESAFDWLLDPTKQDLSPARRSFDDFALLIQRYPNSRYAADARLRMIHLRNRLGEHELHVVRFYVRRGAHVAAAKRAEAIIADYPGAPATREALKLLQECYEKLDLKEQAAEVRKLREVNNVADAAPPAETAAAPASPPAPAPLP